VQVRGWATLGMRFTGGSLNCKRSTAQNLDYLVFQFAHETISALDPSEVGFDLVTGGEVSINSKRQ